MTKQEIVNHISRNTGFEPSEVMTTIEAFMRVVKRTVRNGKKVTLRGFGSFEQIHRKQKHARNIKAGTNIIVPAHNEVKFYPSKYFKIERWSNGLT